MHTISVAWRTLQTAWQRGKTIQAAWASQGFDNEWQSVLVEFARIPAINRRMRERQRLAGTGCPDAYGVPAPVTDLLYRLPGYVMDGWSMGPREGWKLAHCPSNTYAGLRRNLFASLLDLLYRILHDPEDRDAYDTLLRVWRIQVRNVPRKSVAARPGKMPI